MIEDVQHQEVPVVSESEIVEEDAVQQSSDEAPAVELSSDESLVTEQSVIDTQMHKFVELHFPSEIQIEALVELERTQAETPLVQSNLVQTNL